MEQGCQNVQEIQNFCPDAIKKLLGVWDCRGSMQNSILHRSSAILVARKFLRCQFWEKMFFGVLKEFP